MIEDIVDKKSTLVWDSQHMKCLFLLRNSQQSQ